MCVQLSKKVKRVFCVLDIGYRQRKQPNFCLKFWHFGKLSLKLGSKTSTLYTMMQVLHSVNLS